MKIILLKDIKGVGKRFDEKEVSDGYATNFLIPRKLAVSLAGSSAGTIRVLKEGIEKSREKKEETLALNISKLSGATFKVEMKANDKGHLFASLSKEKISEILKKEGIEINPENISLLEPIKETGTFEVPVSVGGGKETSFTLEVKHS